MSCELLSPGAWEGHKYAGCCQVSAAAPSRPPTCSPTLGPSFKRLVQVIAALKFCMEKKKEKRIKKKKTPAYKQGGSFVLDRGPGCDLLLLDLL